MKITVDISASKSIQRQISDVGLRVPDTGTWYQVIHDAEKYGYPRQHDTRYPNRAIPATRMLWGCRTLPTSDFVPMLKSWQQRTYELFKQTVGGNVYEGTPLYYWTEDERGTQVQVPQGTPHSFPQFASGSLNWAWMNFIEDHRALTDGHAFNSPGAWFRDDIIPLNHETIKPWMMKSLIMTGNIVKALNPQPAGILSKYIAIETFDYQKEAPPLEWILANKPYLIWWATEQGGIDQELPRVNNIRRFTVSRFPQLKIVCRANGLPEIGTPYFSVGAGGYNLIERVDVKPIANGQAYSPYVPEK